MTAVLAHCCVSFVTCLFTLHVDSQHTKKHSGKNEKYIATSETQKTIPTPETFLQKPHLLICKTKAIAFRAGAAVALHDRGDK